MASLTHELIVAIAASFIVLGIAKSYRWLSDRADGWGDQQMRRDLKKMEGAKASYADHSLRKMRRCQGFALYLLSMDAALFSSPWRTLWPLGVAFALIAAVLAALSAAYGDESTVSGVMNKIRRSRNRLGLPEEFSVRGVQKQSD